MAPSNTDIYYVVFCRLVGVEKQSLMQMPADLLGAAVETLEGVVAEINDDVGKLTSPYGRILIVPSQAHRALGLATTLLKDGGAKGIRLSLGMACGPLTDVRDPAGNNLTGAAINRAARLAFLKKVVTPDGEEIEIGDEPGESRIAIQDSVCDGISKASSDYPENVFSAPLVGKVKGLELRFRWFDVECPRISPVPTTTAQRYEAHTRHVLVYDIVKYSELPNDQMPKVVEDLRREVQEACDSHGMKAGRVVPTGDGGVLVWNHAPQLWSVGKTLFHHCRHSALKIRIGIDQGPVVVVPEPNSTKEIPVGPGILDADRLSALAEIDAICLDREIWEEFIPEPDQDGWTPHELADEPQAILVRPPDVARARVLVERRDYGTPMEQDTQTGDTAGAAPEHSNLTWPGLFRYALDRLSPRLHGRLVRGGTLSRIFGYLLFIAILVSPIFISPEGWERFRKIFGLESAINEAQIHYGTENRLLKTIAIMPFSNINKTEKEHDSLGVLFSEYLGPSMAQISSITLVERTAIDNVMAEFTFNETFKHYMNPDTIQKAGRLLGAELILTGTYWLDATSCNINVRVIEVETSRVQIAFNSEGPPDSYFYVLSQIDDKLKRFFKFHDRWEKLLGEANIVSGSDSAGQPETAEAAFLTGFRLEENGDLEGAAQAYSKATKLDRSLWEAHFNLAMLHYKLGRTEEALNEFEKVISTNPQDPEAYLNIGIIFMKKNQEDVARKFIELAAEKGGKSAKIFYNLGLIYSHEGNLELAVHNYKKTLEINEHFAPALNNLGKISYDGGNFEGASKLFSKATVIDPAFADPHFNLALSYLKMGSTDLAFQEARLFLALNKDPVKQGKCEKLLQLIQSGIEDFG